MDEEPVICGKCGFDEAKYGHHLYGSICADCQTTESWKAYVIASQNGDASKEGHIVVRVAGTHYTIGSEFEKGMRGHAGHIFKIRFTSGPHKGDVIISTNLWSNGTIPEKFTALLPDNAEFITGKEVTP